MIAYAVYSIFCDRFSELRKNHRHAYSGTCAGDAIYCGVNDACICNVDGYYGGTDGNYSYMVMMRVSVT